MFSYGQRSKCADLRNSYLLFSIYFTSLRVPLYGLAPKDSLQLTGKDPPHSHAEFPRPDSADRSHGFQPVRQLRQVCIINQNLNYLSIFSTRLNFVCLGHNYRGGQCVWGPFLEFRAEGLSNPFCYTYHSVLLRRMFTTHCLKPMGFLLRRPLQSLASTSKQARQIQTCCYTSIQVAAFDSASFVSSSRSNSSLLF